MSHSQQLAIVVMIDVAAAIRAGKLDDHIYLIDNNKDEGSTGHGTAHLVSAIDATRVRTQADTQVLNWLAFAIGGLPPTVPKTFFVDPARARLPGRVSEGHADRVKIIDVTGMAVDAEGKGHPPPPVITRITGEAVDRGVIFPGEYGSPDPISDGRYWSATVNPHAAGRFAYTMHLTLFHRSGGGWTSVPMTWDAHITVRTEELRNGFCDTAVVLPVS